MLILLGAVCLFCVYAPCGAKCMYKAPLTAWPKSTPLAQDVVIFVVFAR